MSESLDNKIIIVKGTVSQAGYEQAICTFIKSDINRKDSFSDKPLYILDDVSISDNMYAVTPNVTEALKRSPRKSIGVMNDNGELIIPIINSDIVKIGENHIAVKTSSSLEELENVKSNPTKVQENAQLSQQIKNKILETDSNVSFVCDDYYGTYDLYEIKGNNLNRIFDNVSYIGINGDSIYVHSNNINEDFQVINKEKKDPVTTMPVELHANVTDTQLDSLEVPTDIEKVKEGAPELVNQDVKDTFSISEVGEDLTKNENMIEHQENDYELPVEDDTNIFGQEEKYILSDDTKPEIEKAELPISSDIKEKEEKTVFENEDREYDKDYSNVDNEKSSESIYKLVRSVKIKLEQSQDDTKKIGELKDENNKLGKENKELEDENLDLKQLNNELKNENLELKNENLDLKHENDEVRKENEIRSKENTELRDKNKELMDEISELRRAQKEADKKLAMVYKELVGFIDDGSYDYQERHSYAA